MAEAFAGSHEYLRRSFSNDPEYDKWPRAWMLTASGKTEKLFPIEVSLNPVEGEGRKGVLATVVDVSERRKAEDLQRLLFVSWSTVGKICLR